MIAANELRIGNWVKQDGYKAVKQIHPRYIQFQDDSDYVVFPIALTDCHPIPLTPEILVGCGFVKRKPNKWEFWEHKKMYGNLSLIDEENENSGYEVTDSEDYAIHESSIQSLHQLQNLYFALTGEELEVRL